MTSSDSGLAILADIIKPGLAILAARRVEGGRGASFKGYLTSGHCRFNTGGPFLFSTPWAYTDGSKSMSRSAIFKRLWPVEVQCKGAPKAPEYPSAWHVAL